MNGSASMPSIMLAARRNFAPRVAHGTNANGRRSESGGRNGILQSEILFDRLRFDYRTEQCPSLAI